MKHLIIGDLHGEQFIVNTAAANFPEHRLLFLGDLVDSDVNTPANQIKTIVDVMDLIEAGRADCLLGNHEMSYFHRELRASGWTAVMDAQLMPLRSKILNKFLPCLYDPKNRVLFSHAGLSKRLWDRYELTFDNLEETLYEWQNDYRSPFYAIGRARGGWDKVGGLLWCDYYEEFVPIPGLTQVFGHTQSRQNRRGEIRDGKLRNIVSDDGCSNWNIDCLQKGLDVLEYDDETKTFERKEIRRRC